MTNQEKIRTLLTQAGEAFAELDFDRWLDFFHSPRTVILSGAAFSSSSYEESNNALMPLFERMKEKGFKRTQLDLCNIKLLSDTTAIASTIWTRFDNKEQIIERLGATYLFLLVDGKWKIAVLTGHNADVVAVTEP